MDNSGFTDWFYNICNSQKQGNSEKPSNKELMNELTLRINDLCDEYADLGIYLVSAERNEKNKIRCNFKIIGQKND